MRAPIVFGVVVAVVLVAAIVVGVVLSSSTDTKTAAPPAGKPAAGDPAPAFTLPVLDANGKASTRTISLAQYRGKRVVLNFWASWCTPCREEFPALREFSAKNPDVVVLGIIYRDNLADARDFADSQQATWPLLVDKTSDTALAYGVRGIPQSFVVGPDGTITLRTFGTVTERQLAAAVR